MNRLSAVPLSPKVSTTSAARVERPTFSQAARGGGTHCLLAPLHYERNYAYPLVVWLHSTGGDERELNRVMPLVSLRNYVAVGMRGPSGGQRGFAWPQSVDAIVAAEQQAFEVVAKARERFNIHSDRIFLAGYEAGGTMALRIALRNPDQFAGAASLNGPFPSGHRPLARLHQTRNLRLLIAHCRDSQGYPIDQVCQELSLFHAAGMAVTLRQYPCEDELTTQMLRDLDAWLMEQVTGVVSSDEQEPSALPSDWN